MAEAPGYPSADTLLDEALEMTFPASDPIALNLDPPTPARNRQVDFTSATSGEQRGQAQQPN
jgi:hypothetical protein